MSRFLSPGNWEANTKENRATTTKTLAFAASIAMLVAISGLATARAGEMYTQDPPVAAGRWNQRVRSAFNTTYPAMTTQTIDNNKYRYHGGPKSND
jgi:hypothetical protein